MLKSATLLETALKMVSLAQDERVLLRILGGVAFQYHEHQQSRPSVPNRNPGDIDVAAYSRDQRLINILLQRENWRSDKEFNFLHGARRLLYRRGTVRLDVIFDQLEMCHTIDLRGRLEKSSPTLPLADLLLSKLQIAKPARKDIQDLISLLSGHALCQQDDDGEQVSIGRVVQVCSRDWGLTHTVMLNLELLAANAGSRGMQCASEGVAQRINGIRAAIVASPKSLTWRIRAKIGERYPWYQIPEDEGN
jgi:hypothetical protein